MSPLRILFAGSGEFGVPTLEALAASGHELVQVISQPDRPAGRGRKLTPTPVAQFALDRGLPLLRTGNINEESLPPADVLIVIALGQKIAEHVVHAPRLGSVNLHASRLPKYRGAATINWAILDGEPTTGNSIIRLAQKMDAGAILAQSEIALAPTDTAGEVHDRLARDGVSLMMKTLDDLAGGRAVERAQDESLATLAPKLSRDAARLSFDQPAQRIVRQIHGLYPWPGCRVKLTDAAGNELARLTLVRARLTDNEGSRWHAGEIMTDGAISTPEGGVSVIELQPEGKRPMSLESFRNGHPWQPGMRLQAV